MTQRPKREKSPTSPKEPSGSAFDLWLERGLHKLFDEVANEPVPQDLMRLIDGDRAPRAEPPQPRDDRTKR